jgi:hypothetical protein
MTKNTNSTCIVTGRITDLQDRPLEGLIVRAYDQDAKTPPNPLGKETATGSDGSYTIRFTEEDYRIGGVERGEPEVDILQFDHALPAAELDLTFLARILARSHYSMRVLHARSLKRSEGYLKKLRKKE